MLGNFNSFPFSFRRDRGSSWSLWDILPWWSHIHNAGMFWGEVRFWKWERFSSMDSKKGSQWKHQMRWVIHEGIIHTSNCGDWWVNCRDQIKVNAQIYVKTRKKKTTEKKRGFHYHSRRIIVVIASCARVSGVNWSLRSRWRESTIHTSEYLLDKIT